MTTTIDHNQLLKKIAKERLQSFGIVQRGQSRMFLCDQGWYTILIEFQPSSHSKGTYVNIGVDFHFYPRDYVTFSFSHRQTNFKEFKNPQQFEKLMHALCTVILKKVQMLTTIFQSPCTAVYALHKRNNQGDDLYTMVILYGILSDHDSAKRLLITLKKNQPEFADNCNEVIAWLDDPKTFLSNLNQRINQTRQLKKLPPAAFEDMASLTKSTTTVDFQVRKTVWWWLIAARLRRLPFIRSIDF